MLSHKRAITFLLDNSSNSIDGDFIPNRFEAQKTAVDRLVSYYFSSNSETQIAIGTIGSKEFGIRLSFSSSYEKIIGIMQGISIGGSILVEKALRCAVISLNHCHPSIKERNVFLFIGSDHGLTMPIAESLIEAFKQNDVSLDIVVIGKYVSNISVLKKMCSRIPHSHFLEVPSSETVLSDNILQSDIRRGKNPSKMDVKDFAKNDPHLLEAIRRSQEITNINGNTPVLIGISAPNSKAPSQKRGRPKKKQDSK